MSIETTNYKGYLGVNLLNHIQSTYPYNRSLQNMHKRDIISSIHSHKEMSEWCDSLTMQYWRNSAMMRIVKEMSKNVDICFHQEVESRFGEDTKKIKWKMRGAKHVTNTEGNRSRASIGNLRWRERGFKKQKVSTPISN